MQLATWHEMEQGNQLVQMNKNCPVSTVVRRRFGTFTVDCIQPRIFNGSKQYSDNRMCLYCSCTCFCFPFEKVCACNVTCRHAMQEEMPYVLLAVCIRGSLAHCSTTRMAIATSFPLLSQESFLIKLGTTRTVLAEEKSKTSIWALKFCLSGHFGPRNETTSQLN